MKIPPSFMRFSQRLGSVSRDKMKSLLMKRAEIYIKERNAPPLCLSFQTVLFSQLLDTVDREPRCRHVLSKDTKSLIEAFLAVYTHRSSKHIFEKTSIPFCVI